MSSGKNAVLACGAGGLLLSYFGPAGVAAGCLIGLMAPGCGSENDPDLEPDAGAGASESLELRVEDTQRNVLADTARGLSRSTINTTCPNVDGRVKPEVAFKIFPSNPDATIYLYSDVRAFNYNARNCISVRERGTKYCEIFKFPEGSKSALFTWKDIAESSPGLAVQVELGALQSGIVYLDVQNRCPSE